MESVLSLIDKKLKTTAEARDHHLLQSKHKAIHALLPYAVWQERHGQPGVLDTFLCAVRASAWMQFTRQANHRNHTKEFTSALPSGASPRAIVLLSTHLLFHINEMDLFLQWAAATSVVPNTEEVAQSVVDTLLQIASNIDLLPHITADIWSWLKIQPPLSPFCRGRYFGTSQQVIKAVRGLKDIEVLKSYLYLVWSEWNTLWVDVFDKMCTLMHEDLCGVRMVHHRADLIKRLDHILGELDQGLEHLRQHNPYLDMYDIQNRKGQYRVLKKILVKIDIQSFNRVSNPMTKPCCTLTSANIYRNRCNVYVCTPTPIASHLET